MQGRKASLIKARDSGVEPCKHRYVDVLRYLDRVEGGKTGDWEELAEARRKAAEETKSKGRSRIGFAELKLGIKPVQT